MTPASQEALRNYLFTALEETLYNTDQKHVLVLGDLFDTFEVAPRDWLQTYRIFQDAVVRGIRLTLVAGNHDWSPKGSRVSAFEMLCAVLLEQFGPDWVQVIGIDECSAVGDYGHDLVLAHCSNQDTFNTKLAELLPRVGEGDRVFLHCNFDNNFAANSDHSLNLSREQAYAFTDNGASLFFAHEHQARTEMKGKVRVFGNQWPTSIADCLNNDHKYAHVFKGGEITEIQTWDNAGQFGYTEVDWRELADFDDPNKWFIKVIGEATSGEAGAVINAIAKFRSKSDAFVITNGVRVDGIVAVEALPESFEAAKSFDVMAFIKDNTTPEEFAAVEDLQKEAA